jgi:uncharacterized membrane protein YphA (DoxX/SURF4 family)
MAERFAAPLVRFFLGFVFLASGLPKILRPYEFLTNLSDYQMVGNPLATLLITAIFPWVELAVGLSLLLGVMEGAAPLSASALGIVFIVVQLQALARGLSISCGCFGSSGEQVGLFTLMRAVVILCLALWLLKHDVCAHGRGGDRDAHGNSRV